jgi:hypothetical protein
MNDTWKKLCSKSPWNMELGKDVLEGIYWDNPYVNSTSHYNESITAEDHL